MVLPDEPFIQNLIEREESSQPFLSIETSAVVAVPAWLPSEFDKNLNISHTNQSILLGQLVKYMHTEEKKQVFVFVATNVLGNLL